jgi:hypothetical protein
MERALEKDAAFDGARVLKRLHYPLDVIFRPACAGLLLIR